MLRTKMTGGLHHDLATFFKRCCCKSSQGRLPFLFWFWKETFLNKRQLCVCVCEGTQRASSEMEHYSKVPLNLPNRTFCKLSKQNGGFLFCPFYRTFPKQLTKLDDRHACPGSQVPMRRVFLYTHTHIYTQRERNLLVSQFQRGRKPHFCSPSHLLNS